ncbi:hypothetical protein DM02DRAFT_409716 [Periconia macrospinosa]|nr:hypothetical protein DM02DRAFT_409716 [Periconia macrospinosa]
MMRAASKPRNLSHTESRDSLARQRARTDLAHVTTSFTSQRGQRPRSPRSEED